MPGSMQLYGQRRRGLCLSIRPSALHLVYGSYLCCLFSVNTWQSVSSCLFFIALLRVAQANTLVKVSYTGGVYPELVDKTVRKVDLFIYVRRSSGGILNEVVLCQSRTNNAVFILRFFLWFLSYWTFLEMHNSNLPKIEEKNDQSKFCCFNSSIFAKF